MQSANLYQSLKPGEMMKKKIGTSYHLITQEFVYVYKVEDFQGNISYRSRPCDRHLVL